jgi:hypothetical protein
MKTEEEFFAAVETVERNGRIITLADHVCGNCDSPARVLIENRDTLRRVYLCGLCLARFEKRDFTGLPACAGCFKRPLPAFME